jgi:hypothetical protein
MDSIEKGASNSSSIVVCIPVAVGTWRGQHRQRKTHDISVLFPSNGRFFWLHNSCFKQICHNMHIARQHPTKDIPVGMAMYATPKEMSEAAFSMQYMPRHIRTTRTSQQCSRLSQNVEKKKSHGSCVAWKQE